MNGTSWNASSGSNRRNSPEREMMRLVASLRRCFMCFYGIRLDIRTISVIAKEHILYIYIYTCRQIDTVNGVIGVGNENRDYWETDTTMPKGNKWHKNGPAADEVFYILSKVTEENILERIRNRRQGWRLATCEMLFATILQRQSPTLQDHATSRS